MAHDVFISYSTKDKTVANAVCAKLEENGIRTWIAPRDVPPGSNFAESIVEAINACKVFVLIWSKNANTSEHILNEINRAFDQGVSIIPFRIQDVQPSSAMSYYLSNKHWLDAYDPSWETHLNKLIHSVSSNLGIQGSGEPALPSDVQAQNLKRTGSRKMLLSILVAALVVIAAWYGLTRWNMNAAKPGDQNLFLAGETQSSQEEAAWESLDFMIADNRLWRDTAEGTYTAIGSEDAFAWSKDIYQGNLELSFDLTSQESESSGCVIIYGDGHGFSEGCLIFCVDWDGYGLEKHTIYHNGENRLTFIPDEVDLQNKEYSVAIEIIDDAAIMHINDQIVFSTFFNTEEIGRSGRIGLLKKWFDPEVTFANVQIKTEAPEN